MLPTPKGFLRLPSRLWRSTKPVRTPGRRALTTASYEQSLDMSERRSHFNAFFREHHRCFKTLCCRAYTKLSVCTGLNHFSSLRNFCKQLLGQRVALEMRHNTGKNRQPVHWITKYRSSLETWLAASRPYLLVIVFFLLISPVFI